MSKQPINREVAFAGQHVRRKVILALTLCSIIPLLLITYAFNSPVREFLGPLAGIAAAVARLKHGHAVTLPVDVLDWSDALLAALVATRDACVVVHDGTRRQPLFAAYDVARAAPVAQERLAARKLSVRDFQDALGAREVVVPGRYENLNTMEHYG